MPTPLTPTDTTVGPTKQLDQLLNMLPNPRSIFADGWTPTKPTTPPPLGVIQLPGCSTYTAPKIGS